MEILDRLRKCARPVVFEIDHSETPCSICGTSFIVGFGESIFIIVPQHIVKNHPIEQIRIYPSSNHLYKFRFVDWWFIETMPEDVDASDMIIIKVDLNDIPLEERSKIFVINLNNSKNGDWHGERYDSQFFLCGFPTDVNEVNYEKLNIKMTQYFFEGVYEEESPAQCCHTIRVNNPLSLGQFSGLSGSPVFSCKRNHELGSFPRFCGMALRGTADSCLIHFLDLSVLIAALSEIEKGLNGGVNSIFVNH